jgi:hypothetical protein
VETRALKARRERRENGEVAGESETENGHGRPAEKWAGLVLGWFSVLIRKKTEMEKCRLRLSTAATRIVTFKSTV